jgi:signal transduction histidine kinase/ligand-binding sensor domain-containing protein
MNMTSSLSGKRRMVVLGVAIVGTVLALCEPAVALNPALDVSQYAHASWTVADGFAKGPIYSIAQTPDGYIWLGTEFGLLRFDGVRTTPWPSDRLLPSTKIRTLLSGRDGTLWIGTTKGLASWKDGTLTVYPEMADHHITKTIEAHDGTIWTIGLTSPTGALCRIRNGGVRCWGKDGLFGSRVATLYEDRTGNLWFGELHGVWQWNEDRPSFHPLPRDQFVRALSEDSDGVLLVLLSGTIHRMVDGELREVGRLPGASGELTTSVQVLRDRDGGLWIGALGGGLTHLHHGQIDQFSQSDGLSSNTIEGLFQDREGNIWVGTNSGLDRFREFSATPATLRQGFSSLFIMAVLASRDGSIWLRTVDGVNHWRDGHVTVYRKFADSSNGTRLPIPPPVKDDARGNILGSGGGSLFEDERGRVWLSTVRSVGYLDHGRFSAVRGVPGGRVHAITGDLKGNVWLAHETQGLFHLANEHVVDQISWARLGHSDHADALAVDPSTGGIWLGFFRGGLELVKDGQMRTPDAVRDNLAGGRINDLRFGRDGAFWVAAEGGVNRLTTGRITTLSSQDGLPCSETHWTMEDDAGDLWLSMPCGLVRIGRTELDAWAGAADGKPHPQSTVRFTLFDGSDGVRSRAEAGGFSPHVAKATDGRVWFLPLDGLSVLDPRRLSVNTFPPPVSVEQIVADRTGYEPSSLVNGRVRLPPFARDLRIDYTALSLVAPEKVRFRYKLEGWDRDWQDVGNRRQAFYNSLPPRNYRFRVIASNNSGVWNEAGASLDFAIAPAYYETRWFDALVVGLCLSLLWAAYQYRVRRIAREFDMRLEERVNERTRVARELHDTLLQTFHGVLFRFQAAANMLPERPVEAKDKFESAIDRAAQAITEGRDAIQDLRASTVVTNDLAVAIGTLGDELATSGANGNGTVVHVAVEGTPRDLHPILRDDIYRIAGEALRNAFRHAHARRIEVEITYDDRQFRLQVRDDGKGIDRAVPADERRGHFGLPGMRERAEFVGGRLDVWSEVGVGTEIDLTISAAKAYTAARARRAWWPGKKTGANA